MIFEEQKRNAPNVTECHAPIKLAGSGTGICWHVEGDVLISRTHTSPGSSSPVAIHGGFLGPSETCRFSRVLIYHKKMKNETRARRFQDDGVLPPTLSTMETVTLRLIIAAEGAFLINHNFRIQA